MLLVLLEYKAMDIIFGKIVMIRRFLIQTLVLLIASQSVFAMVDFQMQSINGDYHVHGDYAISDADGKGQNDIYDFSMSLSDCHSHNHCSGHIAIMFCAISSPLYVSTAKFISVYSSHYLSKTRDSLFRPPII